jgi:purine-nucleoside phosphorylase
MSGGVLAELTAAVGEVRSRTELRPQLGVVLGSGLSAFARTLEDATSIPYREIPHFPTSTVAGHRGELVLGKRQGVPLAVMSGRVHHYEGYAPHQVVFPVRVLGTLGVKTLVLTNAAGAINVNYRPGELMIIQDHINYMGFNPCVGPNEDQLGQRFFDMTEAYDPKLREIAEQACWKAGVTARKGTYVAFSGPSYETPAEIVMARTMGGDAAGMSTVPEVIAARHMGIRVLGISCLTNMGAGVIKKKLDHREVMEVGKQAASGLQDVLDRIVQTVGRPA